MNKLNVIKYYTEGLEIEIDKLNRYNEALYLAKCEAVDKNISYWNCLKWNESQPSKSKIKDYLKNIRRISLEIEKEIK